MTAGNLDLSGWRLRDERRRQVAVQLLDRVATSRERLQAILAEHGVTEAYLFGSMASGDPRPESDVDIGVAGCAPERFYRLAAELERALGLPLDLVDLGSAPPVLAASIRSGSQIYP